MKTLVVVLGALFSVAVSQAEEVDPVAATQKLLSDPAQLKDSLKDDKAATAVDSRVRSLAGSDANAHEIYSLSAQVLGDVAAKSEHDPAKMMEMLEQAGRDPGSFAGKLSPEQQAKLKEIAAQSAPAKPR